MDKKLSTQKTKDLSFLLPFIGLLLFSPLILATLRNKSLFFELPALPLFIFAAWVGLITASYLLTSKLRSLQTDLNDADPVAQSVTAKPDD